ncbi:hypothetical protein MPER_13476, partial [Moniliophthora perniciosa FA553]
PFNYAYDWFDEGNIVINDPNATVLNGYKGGIFQQATSCISKTSKIIMLHRGLCQTQRPRVL